MGVGLPCLLRGPDDAAAVETTWSWVLKGDHGLIGLVAIDDDDAPIALANLRWFARPSVGTMGLYLDDLFTSPEARGTGAATELLYRTAVEIAGEPSTGQRYDEGIRFHPLSRVQWSGSKVK
jgi:GNAT superfamily N-acetyltransferase